MCSTARSFQTRRHHSPGLATRRSRRDSESITSDILSYVCPGRRISVLKNVYARESEERIVYERLLRARVVGKRRVRLLGALYRFYVSDIKKLDEKKINK